jgi:indolepyruvate ferredoxin oxidoreductase beta subunit
MPDTTNILIVGVGGQGVLRTSQVLAEVLVGRGHDVKQSEVHGMSQRGGSVVSEVRYGTEVHSPLAPRVAADFILALDPTEARRATPRLRPGSGRLIDVPDDLMARIPDPRGRNMAALGRLSRCLDDDPDDWHRAIRHRMPPKSIDANIAAFDAGRAHDT